MTECRLCGTIKGKFTAMPTLEIFDRNENDLTLSFDLIDILISIEPLATSLDWYFIEFSPSSFLPADEPNPAVDPWVTALWHQIEETSKGIKITWKRLNEFARNIRQTDIALVVAVKTGRRLPDEPMDLNSDQFEIVVQFIDSSIATVTTRHMEVIEQLKARFRNTTMTESTRRYY